MPTIDHVAVYARDIDTVCAFYVTYLGATKDDGYHNPRTGLRTHFLSFEQGGRLEVMNRPGHDEEASPLRLGFIHVAFHLGTRQAVDELVARLQHDGVRVLDGPRVTGDGYYEATTVDPEGNTVELVG